MNVTVATGHLARAPERRVLPSGEEVVHLELSVVEPDARAASIPVAWPSAPPSAGQLEVGEALLVVGCVHRRFFRAGGSTQSRTEVVAAAVVPLRRRAAVRRLLTGAAAALEEAATTQPTRARRGGAADQAADAS